MSDYLLSPSRSVLLCFLNEPSKIFKKKPPRDEGWGVSSALQFKAHWSAWVGFLAPVPDPGVLLK